jgi:hypothetical protein
MRGMKVTVHKDAEALDIPSMRELDEASYRQYIDTELFFLDHHDVFRSAMGEYPIATTERQVRILIEHLETVAARMKEAASD